MGFFGEGGNLQFRAEFFNIMNRTNFLMLGTSTTAASVYSGSTSINSYVPLVGGVAQPAVFCSGTASCPIQAPLATAGQITNTSTTSRQIQLAMKLYF